MIFRILGFILGGFVAIATLIPVIRHDQWWIRVFDFPRLQILAVAIAALLLLADQVRRTTDWLTVAVLVVVAIATLYQLRAIFPYTILAKKQVESVDTAVEKPTIRLMVANVLMTNTEHEQLLDLVRSYEPDLLLTVETDQDWERGLSPLESEYPHVVRRPLDNTYGMILYSRIPLEGAEVRYLLEPDIPSIHAHVSLGNGARVRLYMVHPRPPYPKEAETTTERDAELLLVGRQVAEQDEPAIVAGDLNDVAWSHTTRLFQRTSRMLDPRIGRGTFNTFHAGNPVMRWPLDHIFHTSHFKLVRIERLPSFGSDHFPMFIELAFDYQAPAEQEEPSPEPGDREEAAEKITKGKAAD